MRTFEDCILKTEGGGKNVHREGIEEERKTR